jgi:hypothetical protein
MLTNLSTVLLKKILGVFVGFNDTSIAEGLPISEKKTESAGKGAASIDVAWNQSEYFYQELGGAGIAYPT